jgi:hypothetical protein
MAYLRFYQRIPIIPGLAYVNISKSCFSLTLGRHYGFTLTVGKNGIRITWGLSGTGVSISENIPISGGGKEESLSENEHKEILGVKKKVR